MENDIRELRMSMKRLAKESFKLIHQLNEEVKRLNMELEKQSIKLDSVEVTTEILLSDSIIYDKPDLPNKPIVVQAHIKTPLQILDIKHHNKFTIEHLSLVDFTNDHYNISLSIYRCLENKPEYHKLTLKRIQKMIDILMANFNTVGPRGIFNTIEFMKRS